MKKLLLMVAIPLLSYIGNAQVGINNTDPKASLDISASNATNPSNTDGVLIPRIEDFPGVNPGTDQQGMMVYLTTTSGSNAPGFYYWDNNAGPAAWVSVKSEDHDWYQENTTTSPSTNDADIFTDGNVGIGISNVSYPLQIETSTGNRTVSLLNENIGSSVYGIYNRINESSTSAGNSGGIINSITRTNQGSVSGVSNSFSNSVSDQSYGYMFGYQNSFGNSTSNSTYGLINRFQGTTGTAYGVSNLIGYNITDFYGVDNHNITGANLTGTFYGVFNELTGSDSGARYGVYTNFEETGSGNKYGDYITIASTAGGTHYGVYSDVRKSNSYAGYFLGRTSFGTGTANRYLMPSTDGTNGQAITTDGSGNLTFSTLTAGSGTLDEAYDYGGAGAGRNIIADNGPVNIQSTDGLRVEGNIIAANTIVHDGDANTFLSFLPDQFQIDAGGRNYMDINHNTTSVIFNEDSTESDFRVESGTEQYMLFVDGSNDAIGIGQNNPRSPLHVGIPTTFDLSYLNTGQDGLFLRGSGNNSGNNTVGSSIGFGPPHTTRSGQRKAAISSVQTSGDVDHLGLAFYVHGNAINQSDMVERMRLNHQGYLGINNNSPSATLDVIGSMQYEDGNESVGFVLASDASGNATWTDPSTLSTSDDDWVVSGGNVLRNSGNVLVNRTDQNYKLSLGGYSIGSQNSFVDIAPSNSQTDAMIISTNYDSADGLSVSQNSSYTLATRSAISTFNNRGSMTANLGYHTNVPLSRSIGLYVTNPGSSSNTYGVLYEVNNTTSTGGDRYGLVADIDIDGSGGTYYGIKSDVEGLGTSTKYGVYAKVLAPSSIGYGLYSDVQSTNDYAAYLIGRTSLGLSTSNRYLMPMVDGTSGQVMTTNGAGQVSFTTISNDDHDWYEEGSTNPPNAITDDIYTQGNVAIGKTSASSPLDIEVTGTPSNLIALKIVDNSTGTGDHIGIQQTLSGSHNESIIGLETYVTNSGNGLHTGISTSVQNGTGNQVGNRTTLNGSLGTNTIYSGSIFNSGSASSNTQSGVNISIQQPTSQISYGTYNTLNASGTSASGTKYGVYNLIDGGTGNHFGVYNDVRGTGSNTKYGTYNLFGIGTTNTGGILYGTYNRFGNSITSTSDKYGNYTLIPSGLSGTHYGTYNDVSSSNGWAGYFLGRNYISERLSIGETDNVNAMLNVSGNSSSSNSQIVIEETTVNDGARMRFTNSVETTNEWLLFGRADNTNTESRFNINHTSTGNIIQIRGDGRVGINNNNPTYALELPNNATVTVGQARANAWITYSDSRVKKKQQMIRYGLKDLLKIQPKSYIQYASEFGELGLNLKDDSGTSQIGFIAQELYKIIPEATFKPENENIDLWSIDYEKLIPVVVQSIKELNEKVDDLESENKQLKTMLSKYENLEARLSALEEITNATSDVANNK